MSFFTLQNGTPITPLNLFYSQPGPVVTKTHRFVEYNPEKCFNSFVKLAVDAWRPGDENPYSNVVAETMKLVANISNCYQIKDRSQQTVTN